MSRYITAICLLLTFSVAAQQKKVDLNVQSWKTAATDSYSVKYPPTWDWDHSAQMGTLFFIFSPLSSANDKFKDNVNLMTEDVSAYNVTLDKYVDGSKGSVTNMIKNVKFLNDGKEMIGGRESRHVTYTGDQSGFHLLFDAYIFMVRGRIYLFTFTGEQKTAASFAPTVRAMATTLLFP